ncbi:MAG: Zn-ribbon domain-containing OB-fold protein [bacterium]
MSDATTIPALRCTACGTLDPGPREICAACLSSGLEPVHVEGEGSLVAWTMIRRAPKNFRDEAPYAVCVVELDTAGLRVTGRLLDPAKDLPIGIRVHAIKRRNGYSIFEGTSA